MTINSANISAERSVVESATAVAQTPRETKASELPLAQRLPSHIPALDGIRGLAVILVLFCHGTQRPFGYGEEANAVFTGAIDRGILSLARLSFTGVDLFFVLSGFLITGILFDAKGKDRYFTNFYARRTVRIFPLYYVSLILFLVIWPHFPAWMNEGMGHLVSSQWWYWLYHSNYSQGWYEQLQQPTHHILHVSWSLSIEEQFYMCWPLVVFMCSRKTLLRITVGMFFGSMILRTGLLSMDKISWAMMFTPCRLDGLAVGAAIALMARGPGGIQKLIKPAWIIGPLSGIAIAVLIVAMYKMNYRQGLGHSPGYVIAGSALFALMYGSLLTLTAAAANGTALNWIFAHPVMRMFGKYSYAIYLFHLPIMVLVAQQMFRPDQFKLAGKTMLPGLILYHALTWILTIIAAWLSWNLMEKHFLKLKDYFPSGAHSEPVKAK